MKVEISWNAVDSGPFWTGKSIPNTVPKIIIVLFPSGNMTVLVC